MHKCGLCCRLVSIRHLSDTLMHYIYTADGVIKLFIVPVAHHSSFLTPTVGTQFQVELLQRGQKYTGVPKFCDF